MCYISLRYRNIIYISIYQAGEKLNYLMINHGAITSNLDIYMFTKELKRLLEVQLTNFAYFQFYKSYKSVTWQRRSWIARAKSYRSILCFVSSLLSYKSVNYTVWKFRPLIMKIFKTECLLHSQLPNTHPCWSAAQEFCSNPFLWVVISEKNLQQTHFQLFCQHLALFLSNKVL